MKIQRFAIALTLLNLALLIFLAAQGRRANAQSVAPVLRGRALELVDEQGRVRAEIKVLPAQPNLKMPDGTTGYPEAVQLRLLTSKNGPNVKLVTTEDGSGLVLGGESGWVQSCRGVSALSLRFTPTMVTRGRHASSTSVASTGG